MDHENRRHKLRRALEKAGADALLVTNFTNVTYLTGFTGDDSYLLVHRDGAVVVSDPRYTTQLGEQCPELDANIRKPGVSMTKAVGKALRAAKVGCLAIEADSMTVALHGRLASELPKLKIVATTGLVENLRQIKDRHEVALLREAVRQAEKAFAVLRAAILPEKTEKQLADELDQQMRLFGAKGSAFPPIVAAGPRAALPHAEPIDEPVGRSGFVLIDWGASQGLYNSDLTRVLLTGRISPKIERIYRVVLDAQTQAIAAIRPGATAHDIDAIARDIIADAGFRRFFGHGLGHGLGLQVHEAPRLAAKSSTVLKPGMVVTVEPGIYLPDYGGVRIEDDVLVTRDGCEVLTSVPKQFSEAFVH